MSTINKDNPIDTDARLDKLCTAIATARASTLYLVEIRCHATEIAVEIAFTGNNAEAPRSKLLTALQVALAQELGRHGWLCRSPEEGIPF